MARLRERVSAPASGVPVELTDHGHRTWRDPDLWERWMRRHVPTEPTPFGRRREVEVLRADWCRRFNLAASAWAKVNGLGRDRHPRFPDWPRLNTLGVFRVAALEQARAWHEGGGRGASA